MNILVVRFSSFGDILQSLPALTALHRRFPEATMTYATKPAFAALVENRSEHLMAGAAFAISGGWRTH